jgi:ribose transport system ATP-binding protein
LPRSPLDAGRRKIGFVVQELGLLPWLPVGINMFLGNMEKYKKFGILNTSRIYKDAENELKTRKFPAISSRTKAGNLPVEKRKLVEITKAMIDDPDILILDETTQALSYDQRIRLYEIIKEQKAKGTAILIVSHDLEELAELADAVTVLRDGSNVGELSGDEINVNTIRKLMVGREVKGDYYRVQTFLKVVWVKQP